MIKDFLTKFGGISSKMALQLAYKDNVQKDEGNAGGYKQAAGAAYDAGNRGYAAEGADSFSNPRVWEAAGDRKAGYAEDGASGYGDFAGNTGRSGYADAAGNSGFAADKGFAEAAAGNDQYGAYGAQDSGFGKSYGGA